MRPELRGPATAGPYREETKVFYSKLKDNVELTDEGGPANFLFVPWPTALGPARLGRKQDTEYWYEAAGRLADVLIARDSIQLEYNSTFLIIPFGDTHGEEEYGIKEYRYNGKGQRPLYVASDRSTGNPGASVHVKLKERAERIKRLERMLTEANQAWGTALDEAEDLRFEVHQLKDANHNLLGLADPRIEELEVANEQNKKQLGRMQEQIFRLLDENRILRKGSAKQTEIYNTQRLQIRDLENRIKMARAELDG
jgi:hypothetical protein